MSEIIGDELGSFSTEWVNTDKVAEPKLGNAPITSDRYWSRDFMEREWEQMWTKVWLIAGLESQLEKPGDFITADIGRESILCTKGRDGKIRAFYNVCQHRGNQLVQEEAGNRKHLTCAYHGWRFDLDGELSLVPCVEDFPQGNPCGKLRLKEIPCEVFAGFIWYSMDENACTLTEYLGPIKSQIECYQMENMRRTHWVTMDADFNWKCVQDNFNESYHLPFIHPQTRYIMEQNYKYCQFDLYAPEGHTRMFMPGSRPTLSLNGEYERVISGLKEEIEFWELNPEDYRDEPLLIRAALQKAKREKGLEKGFDFSRYNDNQLVDHYHFTVFPNISFSLKPDGCIWLRADPHPTDPERCVFDMWYFTWFPEGNPDYFAKAMYTDVDATKNVKHERGKAGEVSFGPAIDQDVDVWQSQQRGLRSRGYTGDYMPDQERRIRFFHENIDRYLAKG